MDFSYINKNGKRVTGAAAFNHHVFTEKGGIENYNASVGEEYIKEFVKAKTPTISATLERNARKERLKKSS